MSHTKDSALEAAETKQDEQQRVAQEILAERVVAARDALFDAESDLAFATDDDNFYQAGYAIQWDRNTVIFENADKTRRLEVPLGQRGQT